MVKIAKALATGKAIKESTGKVSWYKITRGKRDIVVTSAVGHLYGLAEKNKGKWDYPVFDVEWKPSYEVSKSAKFTKPYLEVLEKLSKNANEFTIATDLDIEGETIGLNIMRFAFKQKDANRMKYSTLTDDELNESYDKKQKHIEWGYARAGETRHILDWFWGINLSRALTLAVKKARGGGFKLLTSGRVQGPALRLIVEKEREINAFKPDPYWMLQLLGNKDKDKIEAWHIKDKIFEKNIADKIYAKVKDAKSAIVSKIEKKEFKQSPPTPFDLTTLQTEAHKCLGIAPKQTMFLAQQLYVNQYISYPRTSSQKLPAKLGFKKILTDLSKQDEYADFCKELLKKKELIPNEGKKIDDAHPAIFPTGVKPKKNLNPQEKRMYDLIVKRFFAVFGEPAIRETNKILFDVNGEEFKLEGSRTIQENWHKFYHPYVKLSEIELPKMKEKDTINVKEINKLSLETTPPKRYTESSIIRALEKENLGTKATRATIVDTLFQRGYVKGKSIEATELGMRTIETLEKYCPDIIDAEMTRHFETEMEDIRVNKRKEEDVIDEAKTTLKKITTTFKEKEEIIGNALEKAEAKSFMTANLLGKCPNCKEGNLMIKKSKFGKFVGCTSYPDCKTTFGLPKQGDVRPTDIVCTECGHPIVLVRPLKKREENICINPKCVTWTSEFKEKKKKEKDEMKEEIVKEEVSESDETEE